MFQAIQKEQQQDVGTVQAKLEIGREDDEQEKEANSVADKVMKMSDPEEEEKKKAGTDSGKIRMMSDGIEKPKMKDEPPISMMKDTPVRKMSDGNGGAIMASPKVEQGISSSKGSGQSLPADTQQELGGKMNADFSAVNVHTDSNAVKMNKEIGAKAFTHGNDIYFNSGQYNPVSEQGKHLLAHELTHTVQQGGNVQRKIQRQIYMFQKSDDPNLPADFWGTASGKMDLMSEDSVNKLIGLLDDVAANPFKTAFQNLIDAKTPKGETAEYSFIKDDAPDTKTYRINLLKDIIRNIQAVTKAMNYSDAAELVADVTKRFLLVVDMRVTQGKSSTNKPTGYPTKKNSAVPPRVNVAAGPYWEVGIATDKVSNDIIDYKFRLSAAGKEDAYKALCKLLFIHQTDSSLRTLMHCDYMLSALQYKIMADAMGPAAFNAKIKDGSIVIDLFATTHNSLTFFNQPNESKENKPLQAFYTTSEDEFIIGDHVIFFNHEAYDDLNAKNQHSWRLENAVITGGVPGSHKFQGHGYFSPKMRKEFIDIMVGKFNELVVKAKKYTSITDATERNKQLGKYFTHEVDGSKFEVIRFDEASQKWFIHYHKGGFYHIPVSTEILTMPLEEITADDYKNPCVMPGEQSIRVNRPIESI